MRLCRPETQMQPKNFFSFQNAKKKQKKPEEKKRSGGARDSHFLFVFVARETWEIVSIILRTEERVASSAYRHSTNYHSCYPLLGSQHLPAGFSYVFPIIEFCVTMVCGCCGPAPLTRFSFPSKAPQKHKKLKRSGEKNTPPGSVREITV